MLHLREELFMKYFFLTCEVLWRKYLEIHRVIVSIDIIQIGILLSTYLPPLIFFVGKKKQPKKPAQKLLIPLPTG